MTRATHNDAVTKILPQSRFFRILKDVDVHFTAGQEARQVKVVSLGRFVERVGELRDFWRVSEGKELWFRGERRKHATILRPQLYRPPKGRSMRPVPELLKIENDLYDDFQRCAVQLCNEKTPEDDWDWDSYFLLTSV